MSEPTVTRDNAHASPQSSQLESEGTSFLTPPGFQLTAGSADSSASNNSVAQLQEATTAAPTTTTVDITSSVGAGGVNHVVDVQQIQSRLIELGAMTASEAIDLAGREPNAVVPENEMVNIIRAITYFQRLISPTGNPDGKVSPGQGTETQLNSTTRTATQVTRGTGAMMNHDRLDGKRIRIIQNVLGGRVDGDLVQDHAMATPWRHADETDYRRHVHRRGHRVAAPRRA